MADDSIDAVFDELDANFILEFNLLFDENAPTLDIFDPPLSEPVCNNQSSYGTGEVNEFSEPILETFCNDFESGGNQFLEENRGLNDSSSLDIIGLQNSEPVLNQEANNITRLCNNNNATGRNNFLGQNSGVSNGPPLDIIGIPNSEPVFNRDSNATQFCNDFNQRGENHFQGESSGANEIPAETGSFSGFGRPLGIPVYPVPPSPYSCSCCQVLREITHTNGEHFTKLEVHGRLGLISHAVLESRYNHLSSAPTPPTYQMFDFCKKSIEAVREMLVQYCEDRKQANYIMLQDPLFTYYKALCVGMNNNEDNDDYLNDFDDIFGTSPLRSSSPVADDFQIIQTQPVNQVEPEIPVARPLKSALSTQRARTRKLTLRDFADCHGFPIEKAARIKNVCTTFLKKLCRRHGLPRWPYRRIKSLRRQISVKKTSLGACSGEAKNRILAELEPLETELAAILAKFYHS